MGEYFYAQIEIGGRLPEGDLADFLAELEDEVCVDSEALLEDFSPEGLEAAMRTAAAEGRPVKFYNNEASYGAFPGVERFCKSHGLSYYRACDRKYEHGGFAVWFTPDGGEGTADVDLDDYGTVVSAEDVKAAYDARDWDAVAKLLDGKIPPEIPPFAFAPIAETADAP